MERLSQSSVVPQARYRAVQLRLVLLLHYLHQQSPASRTGLQHCFSPEATPSQVSRSLTWSIAHARNSNKAESFPVTCPSLHSGTHQLEPFSSERFSLCSSLMLHTQNNAHIPHCISQPPPSYSFCRLSGLSAMELAHSRDRGAVSLSCHNNTA